MSKIHEQLLDTFLTTFDHPRKQIRRQTLLRIFSLDEAYVEEILKSLEQRLEAASNEVAKARLEKLREVIRLYKDI